MMSSKNEVNIEREVTVKAVDLGVRRPRPRQQRKGLLPASERARAIHNADLLHLNHSLRSLVLCRCGMCFNKPRA